MTAATDLRRAATLMRERAQAAICPCGGPVCNIAHGGIHLTEMTVRLEGSEHAAAHYASWHPAVALAVADVLTEAAAVDEASTSKGGVGLANSHPVVRVARLYLGEDA